MCTPGNSRPKMMYFNILRQNGKIAQKTHKKKIPTASSSNCTSAPYVSLRCISWTSLRFFNSKVTWALPCWKFVDGRSIKIWRKLECSHSFSISCLRNLWDKRGGVVKTSKKAENQSQACWKAHLVAFVSSIFMLVNLINPLIILIIILISIHMVFTILTITRFVKSPKAIYLKQQNIRRARMSHPLYYKHEGEPSVWKLLNNSCDWQEGMYPISTSAISALWAS